MAIEEPDDRQKPAISSSANDKIKQVNGTIRNHFPTKIID